MMWIFMVDLLLRSACVLLAAEALRRLATRTSPSYRHRIIVWAFGLLLCRPVLAFLLPQVYLPFDWPTTEAGMVAVHQISRVTGAQQSGHQVPWPLMVWLSGVVFVLLPVIADYWRWRLQIKRAKVLDDQNALALLASCGAAVGLGKLPTMLVTHAPVMPQTFGLTRAYLLLPSAFLKWREAKQWAILIHELAHVQRRDVQWQLLAHTATALWWFQPLCWISRRALRLEAEHACDAAVLSSGMRASDYAAELLDIADSFRRGRYTFATIAVAGRGSLEQRLRSILSRPNQPVQVQHPGLALSALLVFAITASALTVNPHFSTQVKGVFSMKRTMLSGLLTSTGLSAAIITGSLNDGKGNAVTGARATLLNPDKSVRQESSTGSAGRFSFENLAAGSYILRVDKSGYAPVLEALNVAQDAKIERGLTLTKESGAQGSSAPSESSSLTSTREKAVRVQPEMAQSNLVSKVQPTYPAGAKAAGIQGKVVFRMIISTEGVPREITVISSPSDDLAQSALEAVRQWRYSPALLNGHPVEVSTEVTVSFTLAP